jgi:hypothetical protein
MTVEEMIANLPSTVSPGFRLAASVPNPDAKTIYNMARFAYEAGRVDGMIEMMGTERAAKIIPIRKESL